MKSHDWHTVPLYGPMDVSILYAGLSSVTGTELITPSEAAARNITSAPIAVDKVFEYTYNPVRPNLQLHLQHPPSEWININVKTTIGVVVSVYVKYIYIIAQVKEAIEKENESLSAANQRLVFNTKQLDSDEETVESIGIKDGDTIEDISEIHKAFRWIHVKTAIGTVFKLHVRIDYTIATVKYEIEKLNKSLPADNQRLIFNKRRLSDEEMVESIGIKNGDTLFLMMALRGGGGPGDDSIPIVLDDGFLDPDYDYNFANESDDGKVYIRGGEVYSRPYGWYRYAMKVLDKYEDNTWLGEKGTRTASTAGEWPVSYHGTSREGAEGIASEGYDEKRGRRHKYGPGIYSSPDLSYVERYYATEFSNNGKEYKIVFQNRVNPANLRKANNDQYWIVSDSDIRPYGILVKETPIPVEHAETSNNQRNTCTTS